jgi:hypothetical protein
VLINALKAPFDDMTHVVTVGDRQSKASILKPGLLVGLLRTQQRWSRPSPRLLMSRMVYS